MVAQSEIQLHWHYYEQSCTGWQSAIEVIETGICRKCMTTKNFYCKNKFVLGYEVQNYFKRKYLSCNASLNEENYLTERNETAMQVSFCNKVISFVWDGALIIR